MLRVLVVDDSGTARQFMTQIINAAPDMEVVGIAKNGREAITSARELRPDVILMDMVMPEMDGLEATNAIMQTTPTPIVVVSGATRGNEAEAAFRAIKQGALTLIAKPVGYSSPNHQAEVDSLVRTVRAMASVHVIRHYTPHMTKITSKAFNHSVAPQIVVIVASTGGPAALSALFPQFPAKFPLPIVVVQHIAPDFVESLCDWLNSVTPLNVCVAKEGETPVAGNIYIAPGGTHLVINRDRRFALLTEPVTAHIPSGDMLLESIPAAYGEAALGVVLTGMGSDGAKGLHSMVKAGAITIAQDESSSVVYGMPKEAVALGAAEWILPLHEIASFIIDSAKERT